MLVIRHRLHASACKLMYCMINSSVLAHSHVVHQLPLQMPNLQACILALLQHMLIDLVSDPHACTCYAAAAVRQLSMAKCHLELSDS